MGFSLEDGDVLRATTHFRGWIFLLAVCVLVCSGAQGYTQENSNFELPVNFTHQHYLSKGRFWTRNDVGRFMFDHFHRFEQRLPISKTVAGVIS